MSDQPKLETGTGGVLISVLAHNVDQGLNNGRAILVPGHISGVVDTKTEWVYAFGPFPSSCGE